LKKQEIKISNSISKIIQVSLFYFDQESEETKTNDTKQVKKPVLTTNEGTLVKLIRLIANMSTDEQCL
jgi:hypothetical protein